MDNLGTEVGHKMRSAVKAKLIELGTGGSAGYIDDELPDYVMIMVANKRSKQQMTEDLNLFLGSNTEAFVTWLHQVLEKLQQVSLSTNAVIQKTKRKSSESMDKKEKKDKKKKLKRVHRDKSTEVTATISSASTLTLPTALTTAAAQTASASETLAQESACVSSITDVFAEHLIKRAQKASTIEKLANVKTKDEQDTISINKPTQSLFMATTAATAVTLSVSSTLSTMGGGIQLNRKSADEFDIPTISEIAKNAVGINQRRRDLNELAELQKKINQAKKHLRALGTEESEDEDFINIKDDGEDMPEVDEASKRELKQNNSTDKGSAERSNRTDAATAIKPQRVPITFREELKPIRGDEPKLIRDEPKSIRVEPKSIRDEPKSIRDDPKAPSPPQWPSPVKKRSIMDRLGVRPGKEPGRPTARRSEKEIYVPVFRRNEENKRIDRETRTGRDRERNRDQEVDRNRERETDRNRERSRSQGDKDKTTAKLRDQWDLRNRVREKEKISVRNEVQELAMKNKVGSRIIVPPPKPEYNEDVIEVPVNSVVKVQPRPTVPSNKQANKNLLLKAVAEAQKSTAFVPNRMEPAKGENAINRQNKLYTTPFRAGKFGKEKSNIVIEVSTDNKTGNNDLNQVDYGSDVDIVEDDPDENDGYVYIPLSINSSGESDQEEMENNSYFEPDDEVEEIPTKFVVTINENDKEKYESKLSSHKTHNDNNVDENNGLEMATATIGTTTPPPSTLKAKSKRLNSINNKARVSSPLRLDATTQKVNKLIIRNDTEDEEELRKEVQRTTSPHRRSKRSNVSPIKFDIIDELANKRSKSNESDDMVDRDDHRNGRNKHTDDKVVIKRLDSASKYDNLPPLSSAITTPIDQLGNKKKERCKYYPTCGKGDNCEFVHPTSTCKTFPNCKYGDQCLYFHPKCKFDLTCNRLGCNFSHTPIITAAAPLSSHVVPVVNYKSISTTSNQRSSLPAMCKFYPNCTNTLCTFYHPKPCRFGKNCNNKVECNFYHFDLPGKDKLKWVASNA